jgi:type I restriction enzyme S subunit
MRDRPKEFKGSIPWIRIEDFKGKWVSCSQSGLCVNEEIIKEMNLKVHPQGTVLCSCSANLGVCAITERPLITNQTFIGIVPDPAKIDTEYLYYLMRSKASRLQTLSSGTTIAYLPRKKFEEFEVCIPPLPEQKKIA